MRLPLPVVLATAAGLVMVACGGGESSQEAQAPTAEDTVREAMAAYEPAAFDTIAWETNDDAVVRGSVVFSYSCKKCHGVQGYGDGGFVTRGDTLEPPSFHAEDWRFRDDLPGLREQVFVGTTEGMPHWGLVDLSYRDIDAVARFIHDRLVYDAPGARARSN
jgi:mono/diheme cytochrome c family protein